MLGAIVAAAACLPQSGSSPDRGGRGRWGVACRLRGGGASALQGDVDRVVYVEAGLAPALRDAVRSRPGSVFVRGHHSIAPGESLALQGCCRFRAAAAGSGASHCPCGWSSAPAGSCGCQCLAPFELTGEDFCAVISGAVVLRSASGLIREMAFDRQVEDPKLARQRNLACISAVAGEWHFMQCQVRSAGGIAFVSGGNARTSMELSEVGGAGAALQRAGHGVSAQNASNVSLVRVSLSNCLVAVSGMGSAELNLRESRVEAVSYCLGIDEKADMHIEASSIADVNLGVLLAGDDAMHARLKLTGNTIRGTLWWGQWRPGTIILAGENSMFGPEGMPALSHPGPRTGVGNERGLEVGSERGLEVGGERLAAMQVASDAGQGSGTAAATAAPAPPSPDSGAASENTAGPGCSSEGGGLGAGQPRRDSTKGARATVPEQRTETEDESEEAVAERPGSTFDKTGHPEVRVRVQFSDFN